MKALVLSASLVLYKPHLQTVERTLLALQVAGRLAKQHYPLRLVLTLVENSDNDAIHSAVAGWLEGIRAAVPDWTLQLQRAPENIGYGRGNNLVIANALSDYHAVVNPDLFVAPDALLEAVRFMESHSNVGLLSPAVSGEDGERHYLCKRNPTLMVMFLRSFSPQWLQSTLSTVLYKFEMRDCNYEKPIYPIEYPSGCFMFFRTKPLQAIGGFDPDFFLHYEDADIGRRILQVASTVYVPTVKVVHSWARDTHRSMGAKLATVRSGWRYWWKWGGVFSSKPAANRKVITPSINATARPEREIGSGRRVLVTGANGFIGQKVCAELPSRGYRVLGAVRKKSKLDQLTAVQHIEMGNLDDQTDWTAALSGVACVVHLAARVHHMRETASDPLTEYRRANVALTLNLAQQAAAAGVQRFVFISSIKVNGEITPVGQPFTAEDVPHPLDPYGISKLEAEKALMQLAGSTGMEIVIIRPVLVYGPGVKANFQTMMHWLKKGIPLPLGSLHNWRSLLAIDNLVDLIAICLSHPAAANQIFLASDGEDLTVTALLQRTAAAFHKPSRLLPVPPYVLYLTGRIFGKETVVQRLGDTLQVDITKLQRLLGWEPAVSIDVALWKAAQDLQGD